MADTKITALTAITTVDPAVDVLPIVDVSDTTMAASGTTKKITSNQILGAGGTATLASATITGALTANGGISMANATAIASSGAVALYVDTNQLVLRARATNGILFQESTGANNLLTISNAGVFGFLDGAGGTRMTLNSTGLGVGASPLYQLHVAKSQSSATTLFVDNQQNNAAASSDLWLSAYGGQWKLSVPHSATFVNPLIFKFGSTEMMRLDASGNVGIGVTPSAWGGLGTGPGVLQMGNAGCSVLAGGAGFSGTNQFFINNNAYYNAVGGGSFKYYRAGGGAAQYSQVGNEHQWKVSSNTPVADTAITFTQAMTLTAGGELLVGTTSTGGVFDTKFFLSSNSGTNKWAVGPYGTATNFAIIPTPGTGGVYLSGTSATSWTAYSDERLKDIIEPITNALAKVGSLRSVIGKFKGDEANTRRPFLIAQDLQSALPEAVDASNPDRLGVAYSDVIPLLVAAIKELAAEVNALKNA